MRSRLSVVTIDPSIARRQSRGLFPGLAWDSETISAVNPRCHLSRELSLLSFFFHIQRHRLLGTGSVPFYSCFLLSLPLPSDRPCCSFDFMTEETEERERRAKRGCERIDIGSFQTGRSTKSFLRRTSRTNELSFRIVNLPRNEMKRWNDVLAPFPTVFTGARAPLRALAAGVDVNDGTTNERAPLRVARQAIIIFMACLMRIITGNMKSVYDLWFSKIMIMRDTAILFCAYSVLVLSTCLWCF